MKGIIEKLLSEREYDEIIFTSPDGKLFTQSSANQLSLKGNLMFLCGHYKGIDHRIREQYVTMELSLGDFVLTGGEIAVSAMVDAIVRLIPGVIGNEESALSDSFQDDLLAPPVFTRPENFKGKKVPEILLSGNHKKIEEWRMEQALQRTQALRPDLIKKEE